MVNRSPSKDPKKIVEQGYDQVADQYARLEDSDPLPRTRWLGKLLHALPPGSSVLDLGCGAGDPADILIAKHPACPEYSRGGTAERFAQHPACPEYSRGGAAEWAAQHPACPEYSRGGAAERFAHQHHVAGVDLSLEQIKRACRNVPSGTFLHADAFSIQFPNASFGAVVSFYALEHIPRVEHASLLTSVHRWLRAGGFLLLSLEAGEAEGMVGEWLGVPMFFSCFDPETMVQMIQNAGFEIVVTAVETQIEQGTEIPYLRVLARRV